MVLFYYLNDITFVSLNQINMYKTLTRLPDQTAEDAKEIAKERHISLNTLITQMLDREIKQTKYLSKHN